MSLLLFLCASALRGAWETCERAVSKYLIHQKNKACLHCHRAAGRDVGSQSETPSRSLFHGPYGWLCKPGHCVHGRDRFTYAPENLKHCDAMRAVWVSGRFCFLFCLYLGKDGRRLSPVRNKLEGHFWFHLFRIYTLHVAGLSQLFNSTKSSVIVSGILNLEI